MCIELRISFESRIDFELNHDVSHLIIALYLRGKAVLG